MFKFWNGKGEPLKRFSPSDARVLIVDDSESDAHLEMASLRGYGVKHIGWVKTAEAALDELSSAKWDVVMIDYRLPGFDGLELVQSVQESYPEIAAIMVTGQGSEHVAVEAMKLGARDYLTKDDFLGGQLMACLQRALRSAAASEEASLEEDAKAADWRQSSLAESRWLTKALSSRYSTDRSGSDLLQRMSDGFPALIDGFEEYLVQLWRDFPDAQLGAEEAVVSLVRESGLSPRELAAAYELVVSRVAAEAGMGEAEPGCQPLLGLAFLTLRLAEEYQMQISMGDLGQERSA